MAAHVLHLHGSMLEAQDDYYGGAPIINQGARPIHLGDKD